MSGGESNAEIDALMALGELAQAASYVFIAVCQTHICLCFIDSMTAVHTCSGGDAVDVLQALETKSPVPTDVLGRELQKWIQCCKCEKWRKVPYSIDEDQIPDNWICDDNVWDSAYNSCEVKQELSDDKIDEILALQGEQELAYAQGQSPLPNHQTSYENMYDYDAFEDSSKRGGKKNNRGRGRGGRARGAGKRGGKEPGRGRGQKAQAGHYSQGEAAEALLGMVGSESDQQHDKKLSEARYYPGQLVWAKVEGHDWWPGKVVRRRAVPREVGPPPGGPMATRFQIPVVFFTPNGIPGDPVFLSGEMDTAIEALKPLSPESISADDEAEYAWLAVDALKPFKLGDFSGSPNILPTNELLIECIGAANRAAGLCGKEDTGISEQHYPSDSDGGWGPQSSQIGASIRGRKSSRGGRGRKGRSSRRGRGRGRWGKNEDDDLSDDDYEPFYGTGQADFEHGAPKIIVESILGWRKMGTSCSDGKEGKRSEEEMAMESAVDALLAAADGDEQNLEFLVKYIGRSHIHNEWVAESTLMQIAKRKVLNFKKRYGCDISDSVPVNLTAESWSIPERFISRRPAPRGPGWEILVKWKDLGIENATWECETDVFMSNQECVRLAKHLWGRQSRALRRSTVEARDAFEKKFNEFKKTYVEITESPTYLRQQLMPHQLDAINWLRQNWVMRKHCMLADEQGLGKTATVLSFINSLYSDFSCPSPVLVIAPSSSLGFWEGEITQWLGDNLDSVTYSGSAVARSTLLENEIWLNPSALDGRGVRKPIIQTRIPKVDLVLTSHEAFASDSSDLSTIQWEIVVFDERHRIQSASLKAHQSISELQVNHKILLSWPYFTNSVQELMAELAFIRSGFQSLEDLPDVINEEDDSDVHMEAIKSQLMPFAMQRSRSIIGDNQAPSYEIHVSVRLRQEQIEAYKSSLTKSYELLADPKASRFSGYRAIQLRSVVSDLRNVCAHPRLANIEAATVSDFSIKTIDDLSQYLSGSEKLQAFDELLQAEKALGRRIAVFAHSSPVLQLLSQCVEARYGKAASVTISATTPSCDCHDAVTSFNSIGSEIFCILMHPLACGLGINLQQLDTIIFFDSDWSVSSDVAALCRARKLGQSDQLRVYRLFCSKTIEENLINLAEKTKGMDVALRQSHGRAYSQASKVLDEILRAGVDDIFQPRSDSDIKQEEINDREIHNDYFHGNNLNILTKIEASSAYKDFLSKKHSADKLCLLDSSLGGASIMELSAWKPDVMSQFHCPDLDDEYVSGEDGNDPNSHSRAEAALAAATFWSEILTESWERYQKEKGVPDTGNLEDEEEDEEEEDIGKRIGLFDASFEEDDSNYRRRGRGRGRGRNRVARKRVEEEGFDFGDGKKRRKGAESQHPALTPEAVEYIGEWARQTSVMNAIADPSTAEALIARNAFDRLDLMGMELGLPREIIDLSHQCAQILLVMRPSEEAPSDFQDYTLVAVIAVATYLGQHPMGEQHGLPTLAKKYGQDATALEQVFEYIIASVNNYRETYMRMQALQEEGALDDDTDIDQILRDCTHPTGGLMAAMSDLDGFAAKLNAILQADLKPAALAAGPLQTPDINLVSNATENVKAIQELSDKLRDTYEQVNLLDRVQNIRVKNIQDEYQRFMERVRAKAQSAIDHANTAYSQQRNVLMSRYEALSVELRKDYPEMANVAPSPQIIGLNVVSNDGSNGTDGTGTLGGSTGINPMNMLSHSMASQLLTLQSHWAANISAQAGNGGSRGQISPDHMDEYNQILAKGPVSQNEQAVLQSLSQGTPQLTSQNQAHRLEASNSRPLFAEQQGVGLHKVVNASAEKVPSKSKSIMEMMEEDFEPEMDTNPLDDSGMNLKVEVENQEINASLAPEQSEELNIDTVPGSAQNVTRVGSLSGWVHSETAPQPPNDTK